MHRIPKEVYAFANEYQQNFTGARGRGRVNVPTLPDICAYLIEHGRLLVCTRTICPVFKEHGKIPDSVESRIKFDKNDTRLGDLQLSIYDGEYEFEGKKVPSLISIAITLMTESVNYQKHQNQ